jgi:hypothetical protein
MKKVIGSILFWVIVLGALGYGTYRFYFSAPNPEVETPLPQKVQTERQKQNEPPIKEFEKDMDQRMKDAKTGGNDLTNPKDH